MAVGVLVRAEAAAEKLVTGRRIAVEGSLRQDTYEKDGEERRSVGVVAGWDEHDVTGAEVQFGTIVHDRMQMPGARSRCAAVGSFRRRPMA